MKTIFIIAPYRASHNWRLEHNIRVAENAAAYIHIYGHAAVCVHTMNRFFQGLCSDEHFLEADKLILSKCDAAVVVGEWHHSEGCKGEIEFCIENDIPLFYGLKELDEWLRTQTEWLRTQTPEDGS